MSYPKQTIELRPTRGFISDTPAHEVGPDFYTQMTNVIVRGGFPQRLPGKRTAYALAMAIVNPSRILHALNCEFSGTNYWLIFEDNNEAWAIEGANATRISLALTPTTRPDGFSSTLLNGVPVISNSVDDPVFWSGSGNLATLTDWTATESCQFITAFQYHLFALNLSGPGGTFPSLLKWSDAAEPGTIPDSWTPGASNEAGDVELSDSPGGLVCAYPMRDSLTIYKRSATYQANYVGGNNVFNFRKVQSSHGALARRAVCDINGQHLAVEDGDIVLSDGSTRRSIGESRVKDWFFNQLDQDHYTNLFCSYNRSRAEVLIGFPSSGNEFCDTGLVYNVAQDSFGVRELEQAAHAPVGVVNDATVSNTYADRTETYSDAVGTYGSSSVSMARDSMVVLGFNTLWLQDASDLENKTAYLGKYSMSFDLPERVKLLKRIHVRASNYGTLFVRAGSQMTPDGSIQWSSEVTLTEPQQIVNCFAQGRYISVELRSAGSDVWRVTGLSLEIELRGYH